MTQRQLTLLVDNNCDRADAIQGVLTSSNFQIIDHLSEADNLSAEAEQLRAQIVLAVVGRIDKPFWRHVNTICHDLKIPTIIFTEDTEPGYMDSAINIGVASYVVNGFDVNRVAHELGIAQKRFQFMERMRSHIEQTKATFEERKIVECAKGILMGQRNISAARAQEILRNMAVNQNRRIGQIAENVVQVSELMTR